MTRPRAYRLEQTRPGSPSAVLADARAAWPAAHFGARWHGLPAPEEERRGVLDWGPLEIALVFRAVAPADDATGFELRHGPFETFRWEARAHTADGVVHLRETVTLRAPLVYGGDLATRFFAARLLASFAEVAA